MTTVTKELFGKLSHLEDQDLSESESRDVYIFTLTNRNGMNVKVINYGAAITSIEVKDGTGTTRDIILGFDNLDGYLGKHGKNPFFGACVGRVANRIRGGQFTLDGTEYQLGINNGPNHLHGGLKGFDKKFWEGRIEEEKVIFSYVSPDGEEGYPGQVTVEVTYDLTEANELNINYTATTTKPTPISLTNHSHFNLGGHKEGNQKLRNHVIRINADNFTPVDEHLVPTGKIEKVENTVYDFRDTKKLDEQLQKFPKGPNGYDINFCINVEGSKDPNIFFVACAKNKESKIGMKVLTNQPGVQFYTSNFFPDPEIGETPIKGKDGAEYTKHGAFCLETQNYPNAINLPEFPNMILRPRETYKHSTVYKFFTVD